MISAANFAAFIVYGHFVIIVFTKSLHKIQVI